MGTPHQALFNAVDVIQHASDKSESVEQWVLHTEGNKSRFPYLEQVRARLSGQTHREGGCGCAGTVLRGAGREGKASWLAGSPPCLEWSPAEASSVTACAAQ